MKTVAKLFWALTAFFAVQITHAGPVNVRVWDATNPAAQFEVPSDLTNAVAIAVGFQHFVALRSDRTVIAWGDNSYGQCSVPPGLSNVVAVHAAGTFSLAVKSDGTVVTWGYLLFLWQLPGSVLTNVAKASINAGAVMVLTRSGLVRTAGEPFMIGSAGYAPSDLTNVAEISLSQEEGIDSFAVALTADGVIRVWGGESEADPILQVPPGLTNPIAVSAGAHHILVIRSDSTVISWGSWGTSDYFNKGQADVPSELSHVVAVAADYFTSFALRDDGTLVAWGAQTYIPPDLPFVTAFAAGFKLRAAIVEPSHVTTPPAILSHPSPTNVVAGIGGDAWFRVQAAGFPPLHYQWYVGSAPIPGATNNTLHLENLTAAQSGVYKVSVSNQAGTTWSQPATLTVVPSLRIDMVPAITLNGTVGRNYRIEWIKAFNGDNTWQTVATVTLTNNPQFYFDASAIGQPSRLYRTVELAP
jgi:hypothetical protein